MNNNPYKRNDRFQNHNMQKNGSNYNHNNPNSSSPGPPKPKGDKLDDGDKSKRNFNGENFCNESQLCAICPNINVIVYFVLLQHR